MPVKRPEDKQKGKLKMSRILNIGERVELFPMDIHFHDISLAFYQKEKQKGTRYLIHSYSRIEGIDDRITFGPIIVLSNIIQFLPILVFSFIETL